jgi:LytS/YehU family sensor histidine kinase
LGGVNNFIRKRFPAYSDSVPRISISLSSYIILTAIFILFVIWIYQQIPILRYNVTKGIVANLLLIGLTTNLICGVVYEVFYTFVMLKQSWIEKEDLKKQQLQQQFDNLKTQVNPHFLFNSLSSLSALVVEDIDKADAFLNEMSKVYRYMLRSNQQEWMTLQQELNFIQSYYQLLKTRYGSSVELFNLVSEKHYDYLLPPLTLQMLVENAIRHNSTGKEQPLQITIVFNNNNSLTVKNNLQKKQLSFQSNNTGLKSLQSKFDLQHLPGFLINETTNEFMVTVPLRQQFEVTKKNAILKNDIA